MPSNIDGDLYVNGQLSAATTLPSAGSVVTASLAANNVTGAKLTATLRTGFLNLALAEAREIVAADVPNAAANGGLLAKDTTPILERVNVGTDPALRLLWAAANVDPLEWSVISPPDLDESVPVVVKFRARMGGGTDTPTITVDFREDIGGSNLGGATGALSSVLATVSRNVTVTATAGSPKAWSISITPGAHGTDNLQLVAAWVEYTRK